MNSSVNDQNEYTPQLVKLCYKTGAVFVKTNDGSGTKYSCTQNEIEITEWFPDTSKSTSNSAIYHLFLSKEVTHPSHIPIVESELITQLQQLCYVIPFSGGIPIKYEKNEPQHSYSFDTNAEKVRSDMLAQHGKHHVSVISCVQIECNGTFTKFPLKSAIPILKLMQEDFYLQEMLQHMYNARLQRLDWFSEAYKVKDVICGKGKKFKTDNQMVAALSQFTNVDKAKFKELLNNKHGLRHAFKRGSRKIDITKQETREVLEIANRIVVSYLEYLDKS